MLRTFASTLAALPVLAAAQATPVGLWKIGRAHV